MTATGLPVWVPPGSDRIYVRTPFELKDVLKATPGSRWDPSERAWHVPATPAAAAALRFGLTGWPLTLDATVMGLLRDADAEHAALAHKDASDDELDAIPGRMPAWLHQKRAYHFAKARRGSMLAMDMGTGKSRTAISLLDGWDSELAIILCPRSVMGVWPNQFVAHSERRWAVLAPPMNQTVAKRTHYLLKQAAAAMTAGMPTALIVNYEAAWREPMKSLLIRLADDGGATVILDESHRTKAPDGRASKFCARVASKAEHVLQLTGTPMPHSPMDIYAQYRALDPGIFGTSWARFRLRYAIMGGFEGRQVVGYQNQDELATKFASASFVVRKSEAGLDLPPVVHTDRRFTLGPRSLRAYSTLEQDFILGVGDGTVTAANALVKLLRLQQVTSGYVRDDDGADHQVGTDKIEVLDDVLQDFPAYEPLVIFARFKHDLKVIREACLKQGRRVGVVSGDIKSGHEDYGLNQHSQMRDDIDVLVAQLQSGGVGIDLSRACVAVYYSLDFSLGNYDQTLARLDRPGQKRSVTYVHLIAANTKDEVVYQALQDRREVVDAVIDASRQSKDLAA